MFDPKTPAQNKEVFNYGSLLYVIFLFFTISSLNAATLTYTEGFESGGLGDLKCSGNCPAVTTSSTASGGYSGDFTLTREMSNKYRTEVTMRSNGNFEFGQEYWLGMDYQYIDWEEDSFGEMAPFQVHTKPSAWTSACKLGSAHSTAPFLMSSKDGEVEFLTYGRKVLWKGPVEEKEWLHITVRFKISYGSGGFIEVWKDGVRLGRVNGANSPKYDSCGKLMRSPFLKVGVYKSTWKYKATDVTRRQILIDNLKIAKGSDGYSLVSPEPIIPSTEEPVVEEPVVEEPVAEEPVATEEELVPNWSMATGTGTLVNGAELVTGEGVKFDGVDDHLDIGNLDVTGDAISLSAWFLAEDLDNCTYRDCRIISKATGLGEQDHQVMVSTIKVNSATRLRFRLEVNGVTSTLIADSGNISENEWTHVVAVYDGETMILYKDGVEVGQKAKSGSITGDSGASFWIGDNPPNAGSRPWKGYIDDVRIYDFPLTENEIDVLAQ